MRKIIYTTNAIESLNRVIRKTTKTRGSFPTDAAATKLIYLAIRNFEKAGRRHQADLSGHPQFRKGGSLRQRMGCRPKPVRYSLPRTVQQMTRFNCMG